MERKYKKKRKRNLKTETENVHTTILTGTVVFFISTRFYTLIYVYILSYKNRQDIADIQLMKMTGISAFYILASLARPPPHSDLISKKIQIGGREKNGL